MFKVGPHEYTDDLSEAIDAWSVNAYRLDYMRCFTGAHYNETTDTVFVSSAAAAVGVVAYWNSIAIHNPPNRFRYAITGFGKA